MAVTLLDRTSFNGPDALVIALAVDSQHARALLGETHHTARHRARAEHRRNRGIVCQIERDLRAIGNRIGIGGDYRSIVRNLFRLDVRHRRYKILKRDLSSAILQIKIRNRDGRVIRLREHDFAITRDLKRTDCEIRIKIERHCHCILGRNRDRVARCNRRILRQSRCQRKRFCLGRNCNSIFSRPPMDLG